MNKLSGDIRFAGQYPKQRKLEGADNPIHCSHGLAPLLKPNASHLNTPPISQAAGCGMCYVCCVCCVCCVCLLSMRFVYHPSPPLPSSPHKVGGTPGHVCGCVQCASGVPIHTQKHSQAGLVPVIGNACSVLAHRTAVKRLNERMNNEMNLSNTAHIHASK